jgi:CHASE2 domain-containing sensor protein
MTIDARFSVRGARAPSPKLAIVAYDNATLRRLNIRPPIPRAIQAELVDRLDVAGAAVVALDYSFEQPSGDERQDRRLVVALLNARRAVVSVTAPGAAGQIADLAGFVRFADTAVRPGYTPLALDPDGVVRRIAPAPAGLDPFSVAAAEALTGRGIRVPPRALIDYPGPARTFPQLSYADVLDGRFDRAAVRGKIVIAGPTATVVDDGHRVPVDSTMPGPEIHAAATSTALAGFPLRLVSARTARLETVGAGFAVVLLALLTALAARAIRTRRGGGGVLVGVPGPAALAAVGAGACAAWLVVAQAAFERGVVVELVPALVGVLASTLAAGVAASVATARVRRRVRERFAARDAGIVGRVLASSGRRRAVTASDVVAGYTIQARIGGGGMGEVYRAAQTRLGRDVALKLIRAEHARDGEYRRRFVDEAHRAAAITHPNVVAVVDAGEADGLLFIAMALIEGSSLAESLASAGWLDAPYAVRVIHRVACALDAAHAQSLVHRDVKPGNILIGDRSPEHPLLTDFGVAGDLGDEPQRKRVRGTIAYLAPECFDGRASGRAADVYALAAVLYECLTGRQPFSGATRAEVVAAHRAAARPAVTAVRDDLPAAIDAVLATAMAVDPAERHQTATAFTRAAAAALGVQISDDVSPVEPAPRPAPAPDDDEPTLDD